MSRVFETVTSGGVRFFVGKINLFFTRSFGMRKKDSVQSFYSPCPLP